MPRYKYTPIIDNRSEFYRFLREKREVRGNIIHYGTVRLHSPTVEERMNITTNSHIWSFGDRYYTLAHQYYGDSTYWWVIALFNGYPTEASLKPGTMIYIPLNLEQALAVLQMV